MNYWQNKEALAAKAKRHTEEVEEKYGADIAACVDNSEIYSGKIYNAPELVWANTTMIIEEADTVSSIKRHAGKHLCALNFASYKHPGGMFLSGSSAQEESLCHESFLYNVLRRMQGYYTSNSGKLNKSLYTNRAIYTPDVKFFGGDQKEYLSDVLTCAAPNKTAAQKYCYVSDEENYQALRDRIDFALMCAALHTPEILILGAFGCGVFGQDPTEVAEIFKELLTTKYNQTFRLVVFAIPDSRSANFKAFRTVLTN